MPSAKQVREERIRQLLHWAHLSTAEVNYDGLLWRARRNWPELGMLTLKDYARSVLDMLRIGLYDDLEGVVNE